jgi:hypothetical protein
MSHKDKSGKGFGKTKGSFANSDARVVSAYTSGGFNRRLKISRKEKRKQERQMKKEIKVLKQRGNSGDKHGSNDTHSYKANIPNRHEAHFSQKREQLQATVKEVMKPERDHKKRKFDKMEQSNFFKLIKEKNLIPKDYGGWSIQGIFLFCFDLFVHFCFSAFCFWLFPMCL